MLMHYHMCDITFGNILGYYSHYVFFFLCVHHLSMSFVDR